MSFNAGEVTAELHLDRSPFIASLNAARAAAAEFARRRFTAIADLDTLPFQRKSAAVQNRAERLSRLRPTVNVDAQIAAAVSGLENVRAAASRASRPVAVNARALVSRAIAQVEELNRASDDASRAILITATAQTDAAANKIRVLRGAARNASRSIVIAASAQVDEALRKVSELDEVADRASRSLFIAGVARTDAALAAVRRLDQAADSASRDILILAMARTGAALSALAALRAARDDAGGAVLIVATARIGTAVRALRRLIDARENASGVVNIGASAAVGSAVGRLNVLNDAADNASRSIFIPAIARTADAESRVRALDTLADQASRAIFIPAVARTRDATRGLGAVAAAADRVNGKRATMRVSAATKDANRDLSALERHASLINNLDPTVRAVAETAAARAELSGYNQTLRRYSQSWGGRGIRTKVVADIRQAQMRLNQLDRQLERTTDERQRVVVLAETARAQGRLRALKEQADNLGVQSPTISVGVRGAASSAATMLGLYSLADRLDGYNVQFRASIDRSLSAALPNALGALEQQLARFQTVATTMAAVTVPVLYTAYASLPAVISGAAAAAGSLGIALAQGLAGAAGVAATALVQGLAGAVSQTGLALALGGTAVVGYGMAIQRTVGYLGGLTQTIEGQIQATADAAKITKQAQARLDASRKGTLEHTRATRGLALAKENESYEQRRLNALYDIATPRVQRLQRRLNDARIGVLMFGGAIMNELAPAMIFAMNRFSRFSGSLRRGALDMIRSMNVASIGLMTLATRGRNLRSLETIFRGIRDAGQPALWAVGNAAIALANVIAPLVPHSLRLLNAMSRLATMARIWTASAAGQRRIAGIWALLVRQGERLARIGGNLAVILFRIFAPATKHAEDFLVYLVRITDQGRRWANSASAQERIADVWALLTRRARWLWRVVQDLAAGLWGVFQALNQSGLVQFMANMVERLSGKFRRLMRAGGAGRRAIVEFGRDSMPILREVEKLGVDLATGFANLAGFVVRFRDESNRPVFREIIRAFRYMVNKLIPFLRHEFEKIGPLLPPLIRELTDWFVIFGRAQPEMIFFIDFLTKMLEKFNDLPERQRIIIARTFAWIAAMKALGAFRLAGMIGALVTAGVKQGIMIWGYKRMSGHLTTLIGQQAALNKLIGKTVPGGVAPTAGGPAAGGPGGKRPPMKPATIPPAVPTRRYWRNYPRVGPPIYAPTIPPPVPTRRYWRNYPRVGPPMVAPTIPAPVPAGGKRGGRGGWWSGLFMGLGAAASAAISRIPFGNTLKRAFKKIPFGSIARVFGTGLIGRIGGFLAGPGGWALMIADVITGGALWDGAKRLVTDFIDGWKQGWNENGNFIANLLRSSFLGIFSVLRFDNIVEGFKRGYRKSLKDGDVGALGSETISAIAAGLLAGMKELPLIGPLVEWLDKSIVKPILNFFGIKSPSTKARGWGRDITRGLIQGILSIPILGPFLARMGQFIRGAKRAFRRGGFRGLGSYVINQIVAGLKQVPIVGPIIAKGQQLFRGARRAFRRGGWRGLGSYVVSQIVAGLKRIPIVGPIISKGQQLFRGARRAFRRGGWRGLGSYVINQIVAGLKRIPIVGPIVSKGQQLFRGARRAFRRGGWRGLGMYVIRQIVAGLKRIPVVGPIVTKGQQLFRGARRAFRRGGWRGLGMYVIRQIVAGLKRIPVVGPIVTKGQQLFRGGRRAFRRGGWRGLGMYVIRQIVAGLKRVPVVGAIVTKGQQLFRGGRRAFRRGGWRGLGVYVIRQIVAGLKQIPVVGPIITKGQQLFRGGRRAFRRGGWRGLGIYVIRQIVAGLKQIPVVGPIVTKGQQLFRAGRRAFRRGGWRGLGVYVIRQIVAGLKRIPVVGPIISKGQQLWAAGRRAFRRGGWRGLGMFVIRQIVAGLKRVPVVGAIIAKGQQLWAAGRRAFRRGGWRGLGTFVVNQILAGLKQIPIAGAIIAKGQQLFSAGRRAFRRGGWRGLGRFVINQIVSGLMGVPIKRPMRTKAGRGMEGFRGRFHGGRWKKLGKDALWGLINGARSINIGKMLANLAGRAVNRVRRRLRSRSPSMEFFDIGTDIGKGLILGVNRMIPDVERASRQLADASTFAAPRLRAPDTPALTSNAAHGRTQSHLRAEKRAVERERQAEDAISSQREMVAALRSEMRALRTENKRNAEYQATQSVKLAYAAQKSDLGRWIQDDNLAKNVAEESGRMPDVR